MVLIFSDTEDSSSSEIIDWLDYLGEPFRRITELDELSDIHLEVDREDVNSGFSINGEAILMKNIKSVFFRRGSIRISPGSPRSTNDNVNFFLDYHYQNDIKDLAEFLFLELKLNSYVLGSPFLYKVNKLKMLYDAQSCGLDIPQTSVYSNKKRVKENYDLKATIMKGVSETLEIPNSNESNGYVWYTTKFNDESVHSQFWYTTFQKQIEKSFEIRCFYLDGSFYSTAIFSVNNIGTSIDFRISESNNLSYAAHKLPAEVEDSLSKLMLLNDINIGSIDLICDTNGNYYFLEVNPMGQFGFYSEIVNHGVHRRIAEKLINGKK